MGGKTIEKADEKGFWNVTMKMLSQRLKVK